MEKINCNVIQDILPLYIDDVVSDDTKELVEEHLQNCEICQRVYHETKADLENDMKISAQTKESSNEANDLKSFRKFLKKRKIKTILLSIAATVICFVAVFTFLHNIFPPAIWNIFFLFNNVIFSIPYYCRVSKTCQLSLCRFHTILRLSDF